MGRSKFSIPDPMSDVEISLLRLFQQMRAPGNEGNVDYVNGYIHGQKQMRDQMLPYYKVAKVLFEAIVSLNDVEGRNDIIDSRSILRDVIKRVKDIYGEST